MRNSFGQVFLLCVFSFSLVFACSLPVGPEPGLKIVIEGSPARTLFRHSRWVNCGIGMVPRPFFDAYCVRLSTNTQLSGGRARPSLPPLTVAARDRRLRAEA